MTPGTSVHRAADEISATGMRPKAPVPPRQRRESALHRRERPAEASVLYVEPFRVKLIGLGGFHVGNPKLESDR